MVQIWLIVVVFFAVFTQSLTGFGSALVAMGLLPGLLGIQTAAPLVALMSMTLEILLLLRYRRALQIGELWRLALASVLGIPFGILALSRVDERVILTGLGVVIAGYAIYALSNLRLPRLEHSFWAYGLGFLAGLLGGAYNTNGPPVVIYGDCRAWPPAEFKSNLQSFFLINSILVVGGHALSGRLNGPVWGAYLLSLLPIALGVLLGTRLDRRVNPEVFRKIVLVLLVVMGVRLIASAFV